MSKKLQRMEVIFDMMNASLRALDEAYPYQSEIDDGEEWPEWATAADRRIRLGILEQALDAMAAEAGWTIE